MKHKFIYLYYAFIFSVIGVFTLNVNYVEGDDARTILYHVFGGDNAFQPPYSAYHSMFDFMMSLLATTNETTLRIVGIGVTFFTSFLVLVFISVLMRNIFNIDKYPVLYVLFLLPFIIPEFLFSSLLLNPTNISLAIILLSHVFMDKFIKDSKIIHIIISIVLFGFGVGFRWSSGLYLFVLLGYYLLNDTTYLNKIVSISQIKKAFVIFPFYILSVVIWIQISGYSVIDIYDVFKHGTGYIDEKDFSMLSVAASAIPFITPALMLLFIFGIVQTLKQRLYKPILVLVLAILPYLYLGLVPMYKYMITIIVPLIVILIYGYLSLSKRWLKLSFYFVVFLPWIFGVQIENNTAWGPGFEIKEQSILVSDIENFNPDKSTSIKKIIPVFGSGMAMPTSEGPRPIFGFAKVFLMDWYDFIEKLNDEREASIAFALQNKCNILQDVNHSFITSKLCEMNYKTKDRLNASNKYGVHRTFRNLDSEISIDVFENKKALFRAKEMEKYLKEYEEVVIYSSYTNIIAKLKSVYNQQFHQKGAYWGVLKLSKE